MASKAAAVGKVWLQYIRVRDPAVHWYAVSRRRIDLAKMCHVSAAIRSTVITIPSRPPAQPWTSCQTYILPLRSVPSWPPP